jgi:hypothetical protein
MKLAVALKASVAELRALPSPERCRLRLAIKAKGLSLPAGLEVMEGGLMKGSGVYTAPPPPGWPKKLPCLRCDRPRRARKPSDRICGSCRRKAEGHDGGLDEYSLTEEVQVRGLARTRIDSTVTIMDAEGRVVDRVPAADFAKGVRRPSRPAPEFDPQDVATWDVFKKARVRRELRKQGHALPECLRPGKRGPQPQPIVVTPELVAMWSEPKRSRVRVKLKKRGLPIPECLRPRERVHAA